MNKTFILCLFFVVTQIKAQNFQIESTAPQISSAKNALKINPIAFFYSTMEFHYERLLKNNVSIQLGAGFCGKEKKESYASLTTGTIYELTNKVTGYSASGVLKLYLKNNQPLEGFYFAPMVRYNNYNFEIYNSAVSTSSTIPYSFVKYNMHFFEGSVCFGFQVIAGSRFTLDTYLGGGIRMSNDDKPTTYTKDNYMFKTIENQNATGVFPRAGFQIGVAF